MNLISNVKGIVLDLDGTLLNSQKEMAYFVTKSNDEDGVAEVLEKLICTVNIG